MSDSWQYNVTGWNIKFLLFGFSMASLLSSRGYQAHAVDKLAAVPTRYCQLSIVPMAFWVLSRLYHIYLDNRIAKYIHLSTDQFGSPNTPTLKGIPSFCLCGWYGTKNAGRTMNRMSNMPQTLSSQRYKVCSPNPHNELNLQINKSVIYKSTYLYFVPC